MKKKNGLFPGGLSGKLIRFTVILVLSMGVAFLAMSRFQVALLKNAVNEEEEKREEHIEGEYSLSEAEHTEEFLGQMTVWAADKVDDEFWAIEHDIRVLADQAEDVWLHPESYARNPVYGPDKANAGIISLQLLNGNKNDKADPQTMEMMERLSNLAPMMEEMVSGNEGYTVDVYIATPDDVSLCMDAYSDRKFDEDGNIREYLPTERLWYKGAVENGDMYVSFALQSYFYDFYEVIFGYPVYADGELVAVISSSARLDTIERKLSERNIGKEGFSVLISSEGQLVCSQRDEGELSLGADPGRDVRSAVNPGLRELIDRAISGESAVDMAEVDEELFYAGYAPLQTVGWTQISFASVKEIKEPRDRLIESMKNSTEELLGTVSEDFNVHSMRLLFGLFVFMFVAIIAVSVIAKKRVRPIEGMTLEVKEFISDGMTFEIRDVYRTGDEIEELAEAFGYMSGKMREYVDEIVKSTAEKEKINAEMEAASQIQLKMLPSIEPDFSGRAEYELYADMDTAKEVGGDFYDFYYLDDDRLVLMIGDVSGKGITAALFMALAKQLIKSQMLLHDGNIVEAMEEANKKLCDESVEAMFVTVWAGVLTLSTGDLEFVNAGHLYAAVRRNGGEFVLEEDKHSFLMGGLSFARYKYNKTTLHDGDVIYLYTDGVTEAHNKENELFGDERLLKALNDVGKAPVEDIDRNVRIKVSAFTDGAEQYDDITTLCFKYKGGN